MVATESDPDPEALSLLQKTAERSHNRAAAIAAAQQLERIWSGHEDQLADLRKSRHTFVETGWDTGKPRVAGIMDEFTTASFAPECIYLPLDPEMACRQLAQFQPDLVFIESAWHGNDGKWERKVSTVSQDLREMLSWCRENGIPTIFWNKEDPVHYSSFLEAASLCDVVFTTDMDCVPAYKEALGHEQVYFLPFAAQPQTHNPIATLKRKDAFNFAGSYYLRYPERQRDIAAIIDTVSTFRPVEIYDRNHGKDHPHYKFPEEYQSMILGRLPFSEIDKAYKGYRYGINMNTIKQSQTMFARRVYELMASNTVVVSNFSRGVRMLFGDLVICSDQRSQLAAALEGLAADDTRYRKFRLLGLRKVMQEHTYAARLKYILSKVTGQPFEPSLPAAALIASAATLEDAEALTAQFQNQAHPRKHLFLLSAAGKPGNADGNVSVFTNADDLAQAVLQRRGSFSFTGCLAAEDFYGENYLTDLLLAPRYSDADGFGKGCRFTAEASRCALQGEELRYGHMQTLDLRAGMLRSQHLSEDLLQDMIHSPSAARISGLRILALDEFNYCRNGAGDPDAQALASDLELPRQGAGLNEFYAVAERLPAAKPRQRARTGTLPVLKASGLFSQAVLPKGKPLAKEMADGRLSITSRDDTGKPIYIWTKRKHPRSALNLETQSTLSFEIEHTLSHAQLVCEFYDSKGQKISHSMLGQSGSHALAIPARCTQVRFGLRLIGAGQLSFSDITFGANSAMPPLIAGSSDVLVLAKQYPAYDDLYKYGFLHSRVRGYRQQGLNADVFRINPGIAKPYDEFEGIDVATGDAELLDATLRSGRYKHVLVHLLDRQMWEVLKKHLDKVKVTIWIHGAEIQHWKRREYEFTRMSAEEIKRQKRLSSERMRLWDEIFSNQSSQLHHVFVSKHFMKEIIEDVGKGPHEGQYSIIHNHIDGGIFTYEPKPVAQRCKILSIRPYSSKKYANDLSVAAILELSKRDGFKDLEFHLAGKGDLFDSLTAPLKEFPNVRLHPGFLSHKEIASLHKQYGVFLTPTRMDSQGVSRDEAMASGLVPITSDVAAIPEFVDGSCGFLAPPEDAIALADAIERLYHDPDLFQRLSQAAAERVRAQSGFEQTIEREIALIQA